MSSIYFTGSTFSEVYISLIKNLINNGIDKAPRNQNIKCFQNCLLEIKNPGTMLSTPSREYPWNYLNKELNLYFSGNCSAEGFSEASKFWAKLANPDNTINSNYGYLVFYKQIENKFGIIKNQWTYAKTQLLNDKDTRQAIMFISSPHVQFENNKDFICTLNYTFNIENDVLNLTVNRRSQDLYFGLPHDINFEYLLLVKMHNELKEAYPNLKIGSFTMFCNNIHIYERNFDIFKNMIVEFDSNNFKDENILSNVDIDILNKYVYNKEFGN